MRVARLASLVAVVAAAAGVAHGSSAAVAAPTGLHGFLLSADEAPSAAFHRTPSFAWNPIAGALRYEFQLSTSSTFRDNGILYDDATLTTPVAAPPLTLPWITGSPHALYARARALFASGASPWSAPFGFDVTAPGAPTPLPSYAGLLRWTPVDGATGYEVWLVDAGKLELVRTNVLDERDAYTFHATAPWIGSVRWRVRALRNDAWSSRINGLPVAMYGPWSPIYTASNTVAAHAPIRLVATVSDVVSDGSSSSDAHALMPAFVWTGDETEGGVPASLFRVYAFTDAQCLNRVYTGPVVGSPAWAPRLSGPLAQPKNDLELTQAAGKYLADGKESNTLAFDFTDLSTSIAEQASDATPTTQVPGAVPSFPGTTAPLDPTTPAAPTAPTGGSSGSSGSSSGTGGGASGLQVTGKVGPPVDLWDVNWPESGYYWTVVAVAPVVQKDGTVLYEDLELPQDVCGAGRVQRFGISSQPSVTTAQAPFATGLSAGGRLVSAAETPSFYGQPLVAWTPAPAASVYEVQWSPKRYPFTPQVDPRTNTKGTMTFSTAAVLPLSPGTWWYRVRGFDFNLPTGVQQLSWSDPQRLVVTTPKLRVTKVAPPKRFKVVRTTK